MQLRQNENNVFVIYEMEKLNKEKNADMKKDKRIRIKQNNNGKNGTQNHFKWPWKCETIEKRWNGRERIGSCLFATGVCIDIFSVAKRNLWLASITVGRFISRGRK